MCKQLIITVPILKHRAATNGYYQMSYFVRYSVNCPAEEWGQEIFTLRSWNQFFRSLKMIWNSWRFIAIGWQLIDEQLQFYNNKKKSCFHIRLLFPLPNTYSTHTSSVVASISACQSQSKTNRQLSLHVTSNWFSLVYRVSTFFRVKTTTINVFFIPCWSRYRVKPSNLCN